jgi:6-phosphogluconolactonase (cycloisomerase 2 family)
MSRSVLSNVWLLCAAVVISAVTGGDLLAQNFVYTNNGTTPNSVSAFSVAGNGALVPVAGSPFLTGGNGGSGVFAANRITVSIVGNFLYVGNPGSNNVSGFSINPVTGVLAAIPGSPFATGSVSTAGISLAATPGGQYLIAANNNSSNATVYSIAGNGALTQIPGSPFNLGLAPFGIKVTPDGKFLIVAASAVGGGAVGVFSISVAGTLAAVAGSPFPDGGTGVAVGVDVDCSNRFAFVGEGNVGATIVDVFSIASSGALTPIPGSPFNPGVGSNSNVTLLSADDKKLFVSNQVSGTITVFSVAANGSLSLVAGSPFPVGAPANTPQIMGTTANGNFLYAANLTGQVSGFSVAANGALTPVPGSPFSVVGIGTLQALTIYPAKSCTPANLTLTPSTSSNPVGTSHTVTATAQTSGGALLASLTVSFSVISGPNNGASGGGITDTSGQATFTYTSNGVAGTDQIRANIGTLQSNTVTKTWTTNDTTPPFCAITAVIIGPPKRLQITTQDTGSGIQSVQVLQSTNAVTVVPGFAIGTTNPLIITATTLDQTQSSVIQIRVTDVAGNVTLCDPVDLSLDRQTGKPVTETLTGIPQQEDQVTIFNGSPGINNIRIEVNGKKFQVAGLKDGEVKTIDVTSAMKPGSNTFSFTALGKPGASATVLIHD